MPSNLPTHEGGRTEAAPGVLYVVATPIGNMADITLRALKILAQVAAIAAEDTRHTGKLLAHHGISTRLISYHEHNETSRTPVLMRQLSAGESLALVTDAGTPAVSDPGYRLVSQAVAHGIPVVPVPGVSAAVTALSVAGLPTDSFVFVGFPAKKQGQRGQQLRKLANAPRTLIFYESPKRIVKFLAEIEREMGDRKAVLCREMTKLHEEFMRGRVSEIRSALKARSMVKGECTLLVAGSADAADTEETVGAASIEAAIQSALSTGFSIADASRQVSSLLGISRRKVYETALKLTSGKKTDV